MIKGRSLFIILGMMLCFLFSVGCWGSNKDNDKLKRVPVELGSIVERALAIGKIDPEYEIVVKSQVSGIVEKLYQDVGDQVKKGEPLLVVKPVPTPVELADARRALELAGLNKNLASRELDRAKGLLEKALISEKEFENIEKTYQETELRELQAREKLELVEKGKSNLSGTKVETVIRSPMTGTILERLVNLGDPVVPLTSYQPGTELMKLADMNNLIFTGTVDEIDVGKLREGMQAEISIGALPGDTLKGELYFISPKSRTKDNAIVFEIKIKLIDRGASMLRAGYSANASIVIQKKENIPVLPERLITFRNDSSFVNVLFSDDSIAEKPIAVGLSDGLNIEVVEGLAVGDTVVERPAEKSD